MRFLIFIAVLLPLPPASLQAQSEQEVAEARQLYEQRGAKYRTNDGLSNLKEVHLKDTRVTKKGIQNLRTALPDCRVNP